MMKVPDAELNQWAQTLFDQNARMLCLSDALRGKEDCDTLFSQLETIRGKNWRLMNALVRAGAESPVEKAQAALRQTYREEGGEVSEPESLPLALLCSPKARQYAEAIRAAADARRAMDEERYGVGCETFAEILEDYAAESEFEVFGPVGLRERG